MSNPPIPFFNIRQIVSRIRPTTIRTSADITIPNYISDQRIISGINFENISYLNGIMSLEPSYPGRYYYKELVSSVNPLIVKISIAPWVGFALQRNKLNTIDFLLTHQVDIFQNMVTINYKTLQKDQYDLTLTEGPCIHQICQTLEGPSYRDILYLLKIFQKHEVNLNRPIEIKNQVFNNSLVISNESNYYTNIWDYLDTHLQQLPFNIRTERQALLEKLQEYPKEESKSDKVESSKIIKKSEDQITEQVTSTIGSNADGVTKNDNGYYPKPKHYNIVFQSAISELIPHDTSVSLDSNL